MDGVAKCAGLWTEEWWDAYLFYFYEGAKTTHSERQSFVAGWRREGWAFGMMKRLNLLFPCNQFVNARLRIISFKTDLREHLRLLLQEAARELFRSERFRWQKSSTERLSGVTRCFTCLLSSAYIWTHCPLSVRRTFKAVLLYSPDPTTVTSRSRATGTPALCLQIFELQSVPEGCLCTRFLLVFRSASQLIRRGRFRFLPSKFFPPVCLVRMLYLTPRNLR